MKALGDIELALSRLGIRNQFFGRAEIKELQHILTEDEIITNAVNGRYEHGFCLLIATDRRLLLIDKKVWFLSMEDVRFDMITEVDYCARLLDATLSVRTINKILRVTSLRQKMLRELTTYLQARVMELRHQAIQAQEQAMAQPSMTYVAPMSYSVQPPQPPQPLPQLHNQFVNVSPLPAPHQQFYSNQMTDQPRLRSLRRIGALPTASLTMQRRFFSR